MSGLIFIHPLLDPGTAGCAKGNKCTVVVWPCKLQCCSSPRFSPTRQMASSECSHCGHLIIKAPIKTWAGLMMWHVASRSGSGSAQWYCGGSESPTQDDQQVLFLSVLAEAWLMLSLRTVFLNFQYFGEKSSALRTPRTTAKKEKERGND